MSSRQGAIFVFPAKLRLPSITIQKYIRNIGTQSFEIVDRPSYLGGKECRRPTFVHVDGGQLPFVLYVTREAVLAWTCEKMRDEIGLGFSVGSTRCRGEGQNARRKWNKTHLDQLLVERKHLLLSKSKATAFHSRETIVLVTIVSSY